MTHNELKAIANEYMQVWNAGKEDLLDQYAHDDLLVDYTHFEKPYQSIAACKAMLKITHEYFPDLRITLNKVVPNENESSITVIWEYDGTHKQGDLFGIEASGKEVAVKGMTLLEVENGLVKRESGIVDNLSLVMQLGVLG